MFKIALRNVFRNKRRTALTGGLIALAVMLAIFLWSFISGVVDGMFDNMIRLTSGHVRILNSDYVKREKMMPLEANIPNYKPVERIAEANPNVTLTAGRIKFGVLLDYKGNNKPVLGTGIVPETESKISHLDQKIVEGRMIRSGQEEMNIGENLARDLGLKLGDTLTVVTQTAYGSITAMNLKIVGIFRYGVPSIDRTTFYLPLSKAQQLLDLDNSSTSLGAGAVTEIFILVKDMNKAPEVAKEIRTSLEQVYPGQYTTKSWQEMGILFLYMGLAKRIYGSIYF
ncbi:MAG: ABC transporter permease, partial [Candidatus Margulisiibacteriota bacterium]